MSKAKAKGTAAETAVVNLLKATHWPYAERRALKGGKDCGDTTGHPGLVFEVKAATTLQIPAWLRETEQERVNDGADFGILVVKAPGVGHQNARNWFAVMYAGRVDFLAMAAGWPPMSTGIYRGSRVRPSYWLPEAEGLRQSSGRTFSRALVHPVGVPEEDTHLWHVYMYLGQMLDLLNLAGYGQSHMKRNGREESS